jgi:hypothetical protein
MGPGHSASEDVGLVCSVAATHGVPTSPGVLQGVRLCWGDGACLASVLMSSAREWPLLLGARASHSPPTHCQAEPSHRSRGGTPGSRPPSAAAHAQVTSAHEAARKADAAAAWEPGPDHRAPADPERREPASAERRALAGAERSIDGGHGSGCPCCEAMALWERAEEQLWGAVAIP